MREALYIIAFLVFASVGHAAGDPPAYDFEAEGIIREDSTWSGRVIVYGDVLVPEGVTLTIEPSTSVYFSYTESSKIEPMFLSMETELLVRGTLLCNGTKGSPVTFTAAPEGDDLKKPERGDWGGIIFDGGESSNSVVKGARVELADAAFSFFYSSPEVAGCVVEDCEYGFYAAGGGTPKIIDSEVRLCEFGVVAHGATAPILEGLRFYKNAQDRLMGEDG